MIYQSAMAANGKLQQASGEQFKLALEDRPAQVTNPRVRTLPKVKLQEKWVFRHREGRARCFGRNRNPLEEVSVAKVTGHWDARE